MTPSVGSRAVLPRFGSPCPGSLPVTTAPTPGPAPPIHAGRPGRPPRRHVRGTNGAKRRPRASGEDRGAEPARLVRAPRRRQRDAQGEPPPRCPHPRCVGRARPPARAEGRHSGPPPPPPPRRLVRRAACAARGRHVAACLERRVPLATPQVLQALAEREARRAVSAKPGGAVNSVNALDVERDYLLWTDPGGTGRAGCGIAGRQPLPRTARARCRVRDCSHGCSKPNKAVRAHAVPPFCRRAVPRGHR